MKQKKIDDVGKDRNWLNQLEMFGDPTKLNIADNISGQIKCSFRVIP